MSQPVYGRIVNFRRGNKTQKPKWCLIQFPDANSTSNPGQLIGRKIVVKYGKNDFIGRIMGFHGKNGVVKVKFRRGVPGQALGTIVELVG